MPAGAAYVADSFQVNGTAATPTVTDGTLTDTISTVPALDSTTIVFQVTVVGGSA